MPALSAVSNLILSFEQASLIPARQLSDVERAPCLAVWGSDIRVSSRERVLGGYIGTKVSINDQYYDAVNKFDTLFSYPNRHLFMPRIFLQEVERKALRVF